MVARWTREILRNRRKISLASGSGGHYCAVTTVSDFPGERRDLLLNDVTTSPSYLKVPHH